MKTLMNRMALIATGVVVLGSANFRPITPFAAELRIFPFPIHLPCWLELPSHACRVVPRPLVRTATGPTR
jgi:hypothetical protein